jgi:hypothetical protein
MAFGICGYVQDNLIALCVGHVGTGLHNSQTHTMLEEIVPNSYLQELVQEEV